MGALKTIAFGDIISQANFTPRVKANVQLKSNISIGAKVEISLKGFTLGVKIEKGKKIVQPKCY